WLDLQCTVEPPLQVRAHIRGHPRPAVVLVVPDEHVGPPNFSRDDCVSKLVAIASIGKEQQVIERHVELAKIGIRAEGEIVTNDTFDGPDESEIVFSPDSV